MGVDERGLKRNGRYASGDFEDQGEPELCVYSTPVTFLSVLTMD